MNLPEKLTELIEKLLQASKQYRVNWTVYSSGKTQSSPYIVDDLIVHFPDTSLNIWRDTQDDITSIAMLDSSGDQLSRFTFGTDDDPEYEMMDELLTYAKAKASRIDRVLEELDALLDQEGPIGIEKPPEPPPTEIGEDEIPF